MSIEKIYIWSNLDEFDSIFDIRDCNNTIIIDCNGVRHDLSQVIKDTDIVLETQIDNFVKYEKILWVWVRDENPRELELHMLIKAYGVIIYSYGAPEVEKLLFIKDTLQTIPRVKVCEHTMDYQEFLSLDILVTDIIGNSYTPDDILKFDGDICVYHSNIMGVNLVCILSIYTIRNVIHINMRNTLCKNIENFYSYGTFLKMFQRTPQLKSARNI